MEHKKQKKSDDKMGEGIIVVAGDAFTESNFEGKTKFPCIQILTVHKYIFIWIYICMYLFSCIYIYKYFHIYLYTHVCVYTFLYAYAYCKVEYVAFFMELLY
jgi:hypothetical protein